ncbi:MAG: ribose 5-phosphate isomerase B [Bacteroidales bacterium]|nr:ribose 5-phosphate isomerase B [Bacteroidales bacterium]
MTILRNDIPLGICCDHAGFELKEYLLGWLKSQGIQVKDFGTYTPESTDYADYAHPMAYAIERGEVYPGIAICGSGNGIAMTLNKHQGIRAAICWTEDLAVLSRGHNDANVLVLPGRFIANDLAKRIVTAYFATPFEGGRHLRRINKIPIEC